MEVDQQAVIYLREPQVAQQLCLVNSFELLDCFYLDDYASVDNQVGTKADIYEKPVVFDRDRFLSLDPHASLDQFLTQEELVNGFKQSWPQGAMNCNCVSYDRMRERIIEWFSGSHAP